MSHKCSVSGDMSQSLQIKECPECGEELEFFSKESKVKCDKCGAVVLRENAK